MESSTRNIGMCSDINWSHCDCCKALRADVDVREGKARSVRLHCEVADEIDTVEKRRHDEGIPIGQICRRIRAKIKKAGYVDSFSKPIVKFCVPVKEAVRFLKNTQPKKCAADIRSRAFDPIEAGED